MKSIRQALPRLGAGYTVVGALAWLLWPSDLSFINNPEAWFVLLTALVVWHATELKDSGAKADLGDGHHGFEVELAQRLIGYHQEELRFLLKDSSLWEFHDLKLYRLLRNLIYDWERDKIFFTDASLNEKLSSFVEQSDRLSLKVAADTSFEIVGGKTVIGYKPTEIVSQEQYDRQLLASKEADAIAADVWDRLDDLVVEIRRSMPQAYER